MNIAIVLAGGVGKRAETVIPKQYVEIDGKPIISFCLNTVFECKKIDILWLVCDRERIEYLEKYIPKGYVHFFSEPGANRQLSIYNALEDIIFDFGTENNVVILDACRPYVSRKLIEDCLKGLEDAEGVLPVLPMKDTIYECEDGKISGLCDRSRLFAGQAPEAFRLKPYYDANTGLIPDRILNINGSTEPAIMAGLKMITIPGDEKNIKITTPNDISEFRRKILGGN